MTSRAIVTINTADDKNRAHHWINRAPAGTRVEFKGPQRTPEQNDRMWAMLTDVALQLPWHGIKLKPADWKDIFVDALKRELRMVPNIDGTGLVHLGRSSSDLSKSEFSDLIELMFAFGASHGVVWSDPKEIALRELETRAPRQVEQQETKLLTHQKENAA